MIPRRTFIRSSTLFVPATFGILRAQMHGPIAPSVVVSSETCTVEVASNVGTFDSPQGFNRSNATRYAWFMFPNASSGVVCNLEINIYREGSPPGNVVASIYETSDDVNPTTQVGSDSDSIDCSALQTSSTAETFTWSAGKPSIGAANHILVLKSSADGDGSNEIKLALHGSYSPDVLSVGSTVFVLSLTANRRPRYILRKQ